MRKILFRVLLFMSVYPINGLAQSFGLPVYLDVATFAITYTNNTCNPHATALPWSLMERDWFVNSLRSNISAHYPTISSAWRWQFDEGAASYANFQSTHKDECEFVFFAGHGGIDPYFGTGNDAVFLNNTTCEHSLNEFKLGGSYTKWAFFKACGVLRDQNPNAYNYIFNGVHAIFGYRSLASQWSIKSSWWHCVWYGCDYSSSYDVFAYLFNNWIAGGQDMWTAYSNAIIQNFNEANNIYSGYIPGLDFAVVFAFGHAYDNNGSWTYFNGATERITNVFRNEMAPGGGNNWYPQGLCCWNTIIGSPQY